MSSSAVIFNGDKLSSHDMDTNMVLISKPTRERSKRIEAYSVNDNNFEKSSCDFDHLYASNMKNSNENCKVSELKRLKELLVLHLDLIQQQSDQLQSKDKTIASLKEENELLKLRLQRSDRRMALKRSKDSPQRETRSDARFSHLDLTRNESSCDSDSSKTTQRMGGNGTSILSKKNVLLLESDTNCMVNSSLIASGNVKDELYSNKLPLSEINVLSSSGQDMEGFELMNVSEGSGTSSAYLNGVSSHHSILSSSKRIGRFQRSSRESNVSTNSGSAVKNNAKRSVPLNQVGNLKAMKNDENHVLSSFDGSISLKKKVKKSDDEYSCDEATDSSELMMTDVPYYTITGGVPADILDEKELTYDNLEVFMQESTLQSPETKVCKSPIYQEIKIPSWRCKVFSSCYSMEGTENLSDDVFEKRHARLEAEEKRRKRWDVQRIREQRQLEHLRENERKRNWLAKSDDDNEKDRPRPCSLYPTLTGITRISIDDSLPVNALGVVLKKVEPREFSLPWKDGNTSCGFSYDKESSLAKCRRK